MSILSDADTKSESFVFQLFVAGDETHSKVARDNLREICESHIKGRYTIQIVDVFKAFDAALENGIFLTPALIRVSPRPRIKIFGDLGDTRKVATVLELTGDSNG
jgi:circadian clock protein KaiB